MFDELVDALFQKTRSPGRRRRGGTGLDKLQALADAAGVVDQSGMTDLGNAAVSAFRAMRSKDPGEKKEHWKDAGIRLVSAIPVVGDLAKLGRAGKYAQTFKGGAGSVSGARAAVGKSGASAASAAPRQGFLQRMMQSFSLSGPAMRTPRQVSQSAAAARGPGGIPSISTVMTSGQAGGGLSAGEKLKMMGQSRDSIDLADKEKRAREESQAKAEAANAAFEDLKDTVKKLVGGGATLGITIATLPKVIHRWSEALVESQRHLAKFDGRMAAAYARLDIDRTLRDMGAAQSTGASSSELARQLNVLEGQLQQLRKLGTTVTNILAIMATSGGTTIASALNTMLTPLFVMQRAAEKWLGGERQASLPLRDAVQGMIDRGNQPLVPPMPLDPIP